MIVTFLDQLFPNKPRRTKYEIEFSKILKIVTEVRLIEVQGKIVIWAKRIQTDA